MSNNSVDRCQDKKHYRLPKKVKGNHDGCFFTGCDIRGVSFSGVSLDGAHFKDVTAGLDRLSTFIMTMLILFVDTILIFILQIIGQRSFVLNFVDQNRFPETSTENILILLIIIAIIVAFFANIKKGLNNLYTNMIFATSSTLGIAIISLVIYAIVEIHKRHSFVSIQTHLYNYFSRVMVGVVTSVGIILLAVAIAIVVSIFNIIHNKKIRDGMTVFNFSLLTLVVSTQWHIRIHYIVILISLLLSLYGILLGNYLAIKAAEKSTEYNFISDLSVKIASMYGTSFRGAVLSNADFTNATLIATDFTNATLTRTIWTGAKKLDLSLVGDTYLKYAQLRELLTMEMPLTKIYKEQFRFDDLDLRGINLKDLKIPDCQLSFVRANLDSANFKGVELNKADFREANLNNTNFQGSILKGAIFIRANLNNANLTEVDLSRARLKQAKLDEANLTGSTLTGVDIEDWGITRKTIIEQIKCEYVYTKRDDEENGDDWRMPPVQLGKFENDDFQVYTKSILNTLEIYNNQKIDPRNAIAALKAIIERKDVKIKIVGFDDRGNNQYSFKLIFDGDISPNQLKSKYYEILSKDNFSNLSADDQTSIEKFIKDNPSYILVIDKTKIIMKTDNSRHLTILGNNDGVANLGDIRGTLAKTINQLPNTSDPNEKGIKELFNDLQGTIESDTVLTTEDKNDALIEVNKLAEVGQNESPLKPEQKEKGEGAIKYLKLALKSLPDAAKIIESCAKILSIV